MALIKLTDITEALGLLTRLPVPAPAERRGAAVSWAYPLAGACIGAIAGGLALAMGWLGMAPILQAGAALCAMVVMTGALHEDGLADTADGLWGGWDRTRRLEIMRDSRIGTYGVLALVFSVGLRWAALWALAEQGALFLALIVSASLSRAPMAVLMSAIRHARNDGLSVSVGRPAPATAWAGVALALAIGFLLLGSVAIPAALAAGGVSFLLARIAITRIGGQTGDILGASQQASEIAVLCALSLLIA